MEERRRYFRVDDEIGLRYTVNDIAEKEEAFSQLKDSNVLVFQRLDEALENQLEVVENDLPSAAVAIRLLQEKVDIIAAELAPNDRLVIDQLETIRVNISACGLAFDTDEVIEPGSYLALDMNLLLSGKRLMVLARVITCDDLSGRLSKISTDERANVSQSRRIRVNFENVPPKDQEVLVQHVIQRQAQQLQERRRTD